jgi:hypothetical protein
LSDLGFLLFGESDLVRFGPEEALEQVGGVGPVTVEAAGRARVCCGKARGVFVFCVSGGSAKAAAG